MRAFKCCRAISLLLALAMIFAAIPFVGSTEINSAAVPSDDNYGRYIGNTATFNTDMAINFLVFDDPASFEYDIDDPSYGDWANDDYWLYYYPDEGIYDFEEDLVLVIVDWYFDETTGVIWYKADAAPGHTLPERMKTCPWVFYNDVHYYEDPEYASYAPDSLVISDGPETYIFDENGKELAGATVTLYEKLKLSAASTLRECSYRWQILSEGEWIDIVGADSADITLSAMMVASVVGDDLTARIRVVCDNRIKSSESDVFLLTVDPVAKKSEDTKNAVKNSSQLPEAVADEIDDGTVDITVRFVYGATGYPVDQDRVYNIQYNGSVHDSFKLPVKEGYSPYLENDTQNILGEYYSLNIDNATEDMTVTVKYWPAKVNYTVIYYQQNVDDDDYTEVHRRVETDFTGNTATVREMDYEGFFPLLYEEVPIASDSSTVIEVYYDRIYYKMTFNLDGGYGVQPIYARYGTPIEIETPTKAGHTFIGWDDADGSDGIADTLPATLPARHSAYRAIWLETKNAKVTVVYWGENAKDTEYSYFKSQELYVEPGTELVFGENQLICNIEPHTHGEGCTIDCGIILHTHTVEDGCYSLVCDEVPHDHVAEGCEESCTHNAHTLDCYTFTASTNSSYRFELRETDKPDEDLESKGNGIYYYESGWLFWTDEYYYLNLNDKWYCVHRVYNDGEVDSYPQNEITLNCTHSHTDDCYECGIAANDHTHTVSGGCYQLICHLTSHPAHTADCYACIQHQHTDACYMRAGTMDSDLWVFERADTVTADADGTAVMNVYYKRTEKTITFHYGNNNKTTGTITAKWDDDISEEFLAMGTAASGNLWSESSDKSSPYTSFLQIMPKEDRDYYLSSTSSSKKIATYYTENPDGTYTALEIVAYSSSQNLTITAEDFYDMDGYEFSHGTSGSGQIMTAPGRYGAYNGAEFYYTRKGFEIAFHNGVEFVKNVNAEYLDPLEQYSFVPEAPDLYEPGSVEFAGWYLNPECTGEEFVLSNHTMDSKNLLLYAKWELVTHDVRFYIDENLVGTENTYQVYTDLKHGSLLQDPHIPEDPEKGRYIFEGWFYIDEKGKEHMWDFENTTVRRDTDVYARWSSNTLVRYEVRYVWIDDNGQEVEIAPSITGSSLGGFSKTFSAKGNEELYEGYETGYFATVQSHTIVMDLENEENNSFIFYYEKHTEVPYTVHYYIEGTTQSVAPSVTYEHNDKAVVTETYVTVDGYLPNAYQQTLVIDPDGENEIIFYYSHDTVNGMYVVHYMAEDLNGEYFEESVFVGRAEDGSFVTATVKDIENFTYDETHAENILSGMVSTHSLLELWVYYERNTYPYRVQYLDHLTNDRVAPDKIVTDIKWEEIMTERAISVPDHTLVGDELGSVMIRKDTEDPTVNIITFYYDQNRVTVTYQVGEGNGSVSPESEDVRILDGIAAGSTASAAEGWRFDGWFADPAMTVKVGDAPLYVPERTENEKWAEDLVFYARFVLATASLTVEKTFAEGSEDSLKGDETFIFDICGVEGTQTEGVSLTVTVHGAGSITVCDLPIGTYTVTERTQWSWRYEPEEKTLVVTLTGSENSVSFENSFCEELWLGGDNYSVNVFGANDE